MDLGTLDPQQKDKITPEIKQLQKLYKERQMEPDQAQDDWKPESTHALAQ